MASAVPDVKLLAAGGQFRNLRDLFVRARCQSKPSGDITDAMDPVFNRIMALPATAIEGFAVKADIVRHYNEKGFDDSFDADVPWDDLGAVRALVDAVSAFAGRSSDTAA